MPVNTSELRRRIKSIGNIRKITKAMEMIAAGKMRKAQMAALASRPYANLAWGMLESLGTARIEGYEHPLLGNIRKSDFRILIVVITTNRGLCGALNTQVLNAALSFKPYAVSNNLKENSLRPTAYGLQHAAAYIAVGRKGQRVFARLDKKIIASFDNFETIPTFAETRPIAKVAMDEFIAGRADSVALVYADFISTLKYEPKAQVILPIRSDKSDRTDKTYRSDYLFEPSPAEVLDELLPRLIELQVYQAILETLAAEHSARMVAMKNASDAAGDLIQDFTLTYNSVRQAAITGELADIVGGRMALRR